MLDIIGEPAPTKYGFVGAGSPTIIAQNQQSQKPAQPSPTNNHHVHLGDAMQISGKRGLSVVWGRVYLDGW